MINYIILISIIVILALVVSIISIIILRPAINRYLDIKDKEIKNRKYEIYNAIDPKNINDILDNYIDSFVSRYVVYKFMTQKIIYINKDDEANMINDITTNILIEISDLYIYYVSLMYNIDSQEDLARYIKNKVTIASIDSVANYNSSMIPLEQ